MRTLLTLLYKERVISRISSAFDFAPDPLNKFEIVSLKEFLSLSLDLWRSRKLSAT